MERSAELARCLVLPLLAILFSASPTNADQTDADSVALEYRLAFPEATAHYVNVQLHVSSHGQDSLQLVMPTWTPGSYLIREYARHVDQIAAATSDGQSLDIEKTAKNRWHVQGVTDRDVIITYRLYCREMSVRTNWVDHDFAVLNGAATFLSLDATGHLPRTIRLELPEHWAGVVTSLVRLDNNTQLYQAENLDQLIDSPIICGNPVVDTFVAGGRSHAVAHLGDAALWQTEKAARDVQRIVEQQQAFWGVVPYPDYKFLNVISEASGGLEHDNGTLVMTSRWNFRDPEKYEDWLSLISHEFFHTWNVRRLRPAGLVQYDYESENLTRSLWIAEGITSYYEDLMLIRAGLINRAGYLKRLSKNIEKLQSSPGRLRQSLAESSFDAWIKFYRPDENSENSRISYYVKGCVVAFLLDIQIRQATDDERSLDDVMRRLYTQHANPAGFTDLQFVAVVNDVSGVDMTAWLSQHIETTDEVDYQSALDWLGLEFSPPTTTTTTPPTTTPTTMPQGNAAADDESARRSEDDDSKKDKPKPPTAWLGIRTQGTGGSPVISGVQTDSPAHAAGMNVGDELIALNNYRVTADNWQSRLTQLGTGSEITVLISRRGRVQTLQAVPSPEPAERWMLKGLAKQTDLQKSHLSRWLDKPTGNASQPYEQTSGESGSAPESAK